MRCGRHRAHRSAIGLEAVVLDSPEHSAAASGAHRVATVCVEVELTRQHLHSTRSVSDQEVLYDSLQVPSTIMQITRVTGRNLHFFPGWCGVGDSNGVDND